MDGRSKKSILNAVFAIFFFATLAVVVGYSDDPTSAPYQGFSCVPFTSQSACMADGGTACNSLAHSVCDGPHGSYSWNSTESCALYTVSPGPSPTGCPRPGQAIGWYNRCWFGCTGAADELAEEN